MNNKQCFTCKEVRPISEFHKSSRNCDGYAGKCKSCTSEYGKGYYRRNKEKILVRQRERQEERSEYMRGWVAKNHEYVRAYQRKYAEEHKEHRNALKRQRYQKNIEEERAKKRAYYANRCESDPEFRHKRTAQAQMLRNEDREKYRAYQRKYYAENTGRMRDKWRRYWAGRMNAEGDHTFEQFDELCEIAGGRCLCCGEVKKLTEDHIVPLSKGGSDFIENLQPLCVSCNSRKGAKFINYWMIGWIGGNDGVEGSLSVTASA